MNPDYYLRAFFIISAALIVGTVEMKRRARVTEDVARQWLENSGYRMVETERVHVNVWVNPARVVARVVDAGSNAADVTLTVKWLMGGVLGRGDVRCISVERRD